MQDAEKLFLNMLLLISASAYWYVTGHLLPAVLGYLVLVLYFVDTTFAMLDLVLSILALLIIIYFFVLDYYIDEKPDDFAQYGFSVIYMFVIFFKSRSIFNAD